MSEYGPVYDRPVSFVHRPVWGFNSVRWSISKVPSTLARKTWSHNRCPCPNPGGPMLESSKGVICMPLVKLGKSWSSKQIQVLQIWDVQPRLVVLVLFGITSLFLQLTVVLFALKLSFPNCLEQKSDHSKQDMPIQEHTSRERWRNIVQPDANMNHVQPWNRLDVWPWPPFGPCCPAFLNHPGHKSSMDFRYHPDFSRVLHKVIWVIMSEVWIWPQEPNLLEFCSPYAHPPCLFDTLQVKQKHAACWACARA